MKTIKITDFTNLPGPRYKNQGSGSGEEFRDEFLKPAFEEVKGTGRQICVDLDGAKYGYPITFLEEVFGGLAREYGNGVVQGALKIKCDEDPDLEYEIRNLISHAHHFNSNPIKEKSK